jgi:hypothetical protein
MLSNLLSFGLGFVGGKVLSGSELVDTPVGPLWPIYPEPLPEVLHATSGPISRRRPVFLEGADLGTSSYIRVPITLTRKVEVAEHRETQVQAVQRRIEHWLQPGIMTHLDYVGGMNWYRQAHAQAAQFAETYSYTIKQASDVLAAVSPGLPWDTNKRAAKLVMHNFRALEAAAASAGVPFLGSSYDVPYFEGTINGKPEKFTYPLRWGAPIVHAWNILAGRQELTGTKRINFSANIEDPSDPKPITVDIWAFRAAIGVMTVSDREQADALTESYQIKLPSSAKYIYNVYADAYRRAAARRSLLPHQVQAIVWVTIRTLLDPAMASRDSDAADIYFAQLDASLPPEQAQVAKDLYAQAFGIYRGVEINY